MFRIRCGAAAIAVVALLLLPATALAHAELVSSDPAAGTTLAGSPARIAATFSEEIDPVRSKFQLQDATGTTVASGGVDPADPDQTTMVIVPPTLGPGEYTVRWTTVTPDDNGVERGTYSFTIGAATESAAAATQPPPSVAASETPGPAASPQPAASPSADPGSTSQGDSAAAIVALAAAAALVAVGALWLFRRQGRRG